jgi:hypothetical protein
MAKTYTLDEIFGGSAAPAAPTASAAPAEPRTYSLEEVFAQPATQPQSGGKQVPGVPYPVAPMDALGMPKDFEAPGAVTQFAERFTENLGDVPMDLVDATKGVIRDTLWADMTDDEKTAGKRLFDDLREVQATRAPLQGAMQFSKSVQGAINRPLALAGMEGADDTADQADRIVSALGQENSRRAAEGLIAQAFGETAGEVSESVISSLVEQYLGARLLGGAGKGATVLDKAKRATRSAMAYTALSSGNHALTEAKDELGLEGAKRWGYAGAVGAINAGFIAGGGALARKLGLEDVAQAMFSDTTPVIANVLAKSGVKQALSTIVKGLGGATLEGGEEAGTEFTAGLTKAAFAGDPEGALDRMIAKAKDPEFLKGVGLAGMTGVAARGAVGAAKNLSTALQKAKDLMPEALGQIDEGVRSRKEIDRLATEREQEGDLPEDAVPAAPPEAQAAPDQAQTPATPPVEGAPVAAPQGATLAPAPDAAAAAPPSVEPAAGAPPVAAPAQPPGEAESQGEPAATPPKVAVPMDELKLANASMAELARSLGRGESYYSPGTLSIRDAGELAAAAGVTDNAVELSQAILEKSRPLTAVEEIGIGMRVQKTVAQLKVNRQRMANTTDEYDIRTLAAESNKLNEDFDTMRSALQMGATDPARLLAYRRWHLPDDLSPESIVARIKVSRKADATEADKAFADKIVKVYDVESKNLKDAQKKQTEEVAKAAIDAIKAEGPPAGELSDINARIKELMEAGCNLE